MGLKDAFLNKGWAGRTLSRQETADRINPLLRRHHELNHRYEQAIRTVGDREAAQTISTFQKTARADVGKLSETVLSAGHPAYTGVDLEAETFKMEGDEAAIIRQLLESESEFEQLLSDELGLEHQIRTRAVLSVVLENSRSRLEFLRGLEKRFGRTRKVEAR